MLPSIPVEVDNTTLTTPQIDWLTSIVSMIHGVDPLRPSGSILRQSLDAFRNAHRITLGRWVRRTTITLGGVPGAGKVLELPPEEGASA